MYRSSDWTCVDPDEESAVCDQKCKDEGETGGTFNVNLGICICTHTTECDAECERTRASCQIKRDGNGQVTLTYTEKSSGSSSSFSISSEIGIGDHDNDDHNCEFLFFESNRKLAAFVPRSLVDVQDVVGGGNQNQQQSRRRRRAVGDNSTITPPNSGLAIANPTICLVTSQALIFKVEINPTNRSLSHYPRYRKNHLLNTNDEFDYGNFRQLHSLVQESNNSLSYFVHVFTQNGTFVFYDNAEPFRETIVTVKRNGTTNCSDVSLSPTTEIVLGKIGIGSTEVTTVNN